MAEAALAGCTAGAAADPGTSAEEMLGSRC
jgi:hypothetical protein